MSARSIGEEEGYARVLAALDNCSYNRGHVARGAARALADWINKDSVDPVTVTIAEGPPPQVKP